MIGELLTEWRGHVLVLTLSNPSKRNALDPALCNALADFESIIFVILPLAVVDFAKKQPVQPRTRDGAAVS